MKNVFLSLISILVLTACGSEVKIEYATDLVELSASGPFFEGSNTLTGDLSPVLDVDVSQIKGARLVGVELFIPDDASFPEIGEITFYLTSETASMQKLAFLNPVPTDKGTLVLEVADDQKKVADFFKDGRFTAVADLNLVEDFDEDLALGVKMIFELAVKK
jgi:hypothetical protein